MLRKSVQSAILLGLIYLASVILAEPPSSYGAPPPSGYGDSGGTGYGGGNGNGNGGYGGSGGHGHYQQENYPPRPYKFNYAVNDHYSGANFRQQEASDGNRVNGQYTVLLPDGRTQIVKYNADWKNGFNAEVTYQGEAKYPEPNKGYGAASPSGYGPPAPSYGNPPSGPSTSYGAGPSGGYSG